MTLDDSVHAFRLRVMARAGAGEREPGLPGGGDLAHPVLPLAAPIRGLRSRRATPRRLGPRRGRPPALSVQDALDRYLTFYNHQRPHLGYRTLGRTPAEIFMPAQEVHSWATTCQHPSETGHTRSRLNDGGRAISDGSAPRGRRSRP